MASSPRDRKPSRLAHKYELRLPTVPARLFPSDSFLPIHSFPATGNALSSGIMKILIVISAILMTLSLAAARAADHDTRCFEMRTYYAAPGKLDDLHARFRDHTMNLFENNGMENIGYWTPLDNPDRKLIYILAFPSREAREKSWKEFGVDPDWQAAQKASEVNGRLGLKVESGFLAATDYSPAITPMKANGGRVFELRTYHASPGKLDNLHARFRDHTMALFTKHGIMNFGYWTPTEKKDG